jgi:deubiquitinase DESI2
MLIGQSQATVSISPTEPRTPEPVILHVYSISDRVNRFSLMVGLGLYHTAVEVYGQEHSFIGHPFPFTGIVSIAPKSAGYIYHEGLEMGRTCMSEQTVGNHLKEFGRIFTGHSYHLLHNK